MRVNKVYTVFYLYIAIVALTSFVLPVIFDTLIPYVFDKYFFASFLFLQLLGFGVPLWFSLYKTSTLNEQTGIKQIGFESLRMDAQPIERKWLLLAPVMGIATFYGFSFAKNGVETLLASSMADGQFSSQIQVVSIHTFLLFVLLFALLPSIFEEILYRGMFYDAFKHHSYVVLILPTIAFAVAHKGLVSFFGALILGLVTMFVMMKTGQLMYSMLIHFTYNVLFLVHSHLLKLPLSPEAESVANASQPELTSAALFQFAISVVFFMLLLILSKTKSNIPPAMVFSAAHQPNVHKKTVFILFPIVIALVAVVLNVLL